MLLAELEIRHSRPIAPTRRVALGLSVLPMEPSPGWGPVLLGGLIAANAPSLDTDATIDLYNLVEILESGTTVSQPRLRHRFQKDFVGLDRSVHSLVGEGEQVWFNFDDHALPEVNVLGALYAATALPIEHRKATFGVIRKALLWDDPLDIIFIAHLLGDESSFSRWSTMPVDMRWAMQLLGYGPSDQPSKVDVKDRFRQRVWGAHPDRGGDAESMVELTAAKRILLG
jgi:hypothetical protein